MHYVFATITPKNEYFASARDAILSIVSETRQEPGCIKFDVLTSIDETCLYLYEEWQDPIALESHYEKEYTKRVFAAYEEWLAKDPEIITMKKVS